jgi:hypothetical protein
MAQRFDPTAVHNDGVFPCIDIPLGSTMSWEAQVEGFPERGVVAIRNGAGKRSGCRAVNGC